MEGAREGRRGRERKKGERKEGREEVREGERERNEALQSLIHFNTFKELFNKGKNSWINFYHIYTFHRL